MITLGDILLAGESNDVWCNFNPEQWWWCYKCERVYQAKSLRVVTQSSGRFAACRGCRSTRFLWWFHGWPSLVLHRWRPFPKEGERFHLPQDWMGDDSLPEEPGTGQFSNNQRRVTKLE